jgi:hypothetical protein
MLRQWRRQINKECPKRINRVTRAAISKIYVSKKLSLLVLKGGLKTPNGWLGRG